MTCSSYFHRPADICTSISLGLLLTSADYLGIPIRSNIYRLYNVHGFPYTTDTFLKYLSHCMGLPDLQVIYLFFFRIWRPEYFFIYLLGDVGQDIYFQLYPCPDIYLQKNCQSPPSEIIYVHSLSMLDFSPTPK